MIKWIKKQLIEREDFINEVELVEDYEVCPLCGEDARVYEDYLYCFDGCRRKFDKNIFEEVE